MDKYYRVNEIVDRYSILKVLGQGRYGIAYLAEDEYKNKVVIKQLKKEMLKETRKKLFYEVEILQSLNYSCFPKFISYFKDEDREGYIMEYIEGTVLYDLITDEDYVFSKKEVYEIATKILEIIVILQTNKIVHRDIRLPNLILRENNELVLIDFGLARYIDGIEHNESIDYWYLGDCLIHLLYTSYENSYASEDNDEIEEEEKPWFEELVLSEDEKEFLKTLMGIEREYLSIKEVINGLNIIKLKMN